MISNVIMLAGRNIRPAPFKLIGAGEAIGIVSALGTMASNQYTAGASKELTREGWRLQQAENDKSRQWQREEWNRQFAAENAYNDPRAISQRLANAGINPLSAFENGNAPVGSSTPGTPSAPSNSFASPLPPVNPAAGIMDVAQAMLALSEAKKNEVLTPKQAAQIDSTIENLGAQTDLTMTRNQREQLELQYREIYGQQQISNDIAKQIAEISRLHSEVDLNVKRGDLADSERVLNEYKQSTERWLSKLHGVEYERAKFLVDHQLETWQADMAEKRASANRLNEEAADLRLTREQRNRLTSAQADIAEFESAIRSNDKFISDKTKWTKVQTAVAELAQIGVVTEWQRAQLDKLIRENKFIEANQLLNSLDHSVDWATKISHGFNESVRTATGLGR